MTRRLAGLLALLLRGGQFGRNGADKTFVARQAEDVIDRIGFEQMVAAARDGNPRVAIRPTSHLGPGCHGGGALVWACGGIEGLPNQLAPRGGPGPVAEGGTGR